MANLFCVALVFLFAQGCLSATFTLTNNCGYTVWPGVLSNAGSPALATTGFVLEPGQSKALNAPAAWSGRLWGRTLCSADSAGKFSCGTGDCASGKVECSGGGAATPATLAEFTLGGGGGGGGMDYYDVSLVDGYNLPMLVAPQGVGGCGSAGCVADLNGLCPSELKVVARTGDNGGGESVACKSACEAFGAAQYCCSGAYSNPNTCKPSSYSQFFKNACPKAYSYAYDDATSTFTCAAANYLITFCPSSNTTSTQKSSGQNPNANVGMPATDGLPSNGDGGMVFLGDGYDFSVASSVVARATASLAAPALSLLIL
ncbi:thaumatin-like protein 1b [Canna indica]|uniref:Thaumatin-like protein 1b n=1 Tax=Canna indica TaxID=4628 RepID=A0AAQ3KX94_9LILI|nr:thaumatin-like protein 1b [Canna indica]